MTKRTSITSFPHNLVNNKRFAFFASVTLIGVLFIAAIILVLTRNIPSADVVTDPVGRLAKRVSLGNGSLSYNQGGQTKTKPSNAVDIRIKAIPKVTYQLQGNNRVNQLNGVTPKITVVPAGSNAQNSIVRDLAATTTNPAGTTNTRDLRSTFDSDDYRNGINATNSNIDVILNVPNYLSAKMTNIADPKNVVFPQALLAGNFVDNGESKDKVDEADAAKCGPAFNQPITDQNKACDVNLDGAIDEADYAIWGPNFNKTGTGN